MEELIPLFAIFFVIGVPVMSLAARFVLRPLLKDLTAAVRGGKADEIGELRDRLGRLETHMLEQGQQLDQLIEAELFRRQLEQKEMPPPSLGSPDAPQQRASRPTSTTQ